MWADLNDGLIDAILLSGKDGSRQKVKSFINELGRGTVSFTDEEFGQDQTVREEGRPRRGACDCCAG